MEKLRIATLGISWGIAHEAVSRRPPISLCRMVARTHMYTYDAKVWDCPSFKDILCSPVPTPVPTPPLRFAFFSSLYAPCFLSLLPAPCPLPTCLLGGHHLNVDSG